MSVSFYNRERTFKKAGLITGLVACLVVFGFYLAFGGERPFTIHPWTVITGLVFSLPLLLLVGIGFYWTMASGILLSLIGLLSAGFWTFGVFHSQTPWFQLLTGIVLSGPFIASGILLILSRTKYRNE